MPYLLALAVGSVLLADASWKSVTNYRSGYGLDRQFAAGPALASRVVIVVFDGLRVDRAAELPAFGSLSRRGTSGTMRVTLPSLSNPARAAIVTGAWPEVSGVTNNSDFARPPVQSLFSLARGRGMELSVFGSRFWPRAFGDSTGDAFRGPSRRPSSYGTADLIGWQADACEEATASFAGSAAKLLVVGLVAGDEAGHTYGGDSEGYREVTAAVDDCLGRLVNTVGEDATFVAVSDHGHIDRWGKGGHGGEEPEVIGAPFAMAGPGVRRSEPIESRIVDIAPTVSVLLGLPIPANSQGSVLWGALDVPAEHVAVLRDLERVQREALEAHMPNRKESLAVQRSERLPLAIAACGWFLFVAVAALYSQRLRSFAIAALVFATLFYALFYFFQLGYSLSHMVRQEYQYSFFARVIAAAAMAFGGAAFCLRPLVGPGAEPVLRLSMLVTSAFGLFVTVTYYLHGLRMDGWMIEIGPGFKAYLDLLAILGVVLATIVAMTAIALFGRREARA